MCVDRAEVSRDDDDDNTEQTLLVFVLHDVATRAKCAIGAAWNFPRLCRKNRPFLRLVLHLTEFNSPDPI